MALGSADLDRRFDYHRPDAAKVEGIELIRAGCRALADGLDELVPDGREKSLAITSLEEVMMWAIAGVARP